MDGTDVVATPAPVESPKPSPGFGSPTSSNVSKPPSKQSSNSSPQVPPVPSFPPPKTDKPRPHVCTTCGRSFARLEHLKRHERSHTKEKPFECQACTRCFARRDLLLRHQQKLHSATTPSSRPRNGRRESAAGVATGRVRKNSMAAAANNNAMRPRANTLSHIDSSALGISSGSSFGRPFPTTHNHHASFIGMNLGPEYSHRGIGMSHPANIMGLPRLDTTAISMDMSSGLRTAPPYGGFGAEFDMDMTGYGHVGSNTINPHELHTPSMHGLGIGHHQDFLTSPYPSISASQAVVDDDGVFDWVTQGFENQMSFGNTHENAIESSPSAMDTNSPATFQDPVSRMNSQPLAGNTRVDNRWQASPGQVMHSPMGMDANSLFTDIPNTADNTISPKSLMAQNNTGFDTNFSNLSAIPAAENVSLGAMVDGQFGLPFKHEHFASNASSASMDSSMRQSSILTHTSDLVSDRMRIDLVSALSTCAGFGQRRSSVPAVSSPLSPTGNNQPKIFNAATFPSTSELQRYVSAYFRFSHPHLPFLHLPTLNFESVEYRTRLNGAHYSSASTNGGSCLLLSIAAMGALMEHEITHSQELFECSKRLISSCLEERRLVNMHRPPFAPHHSMDGEDTPLWLVQAMLLNVVYGHNCGDKTAADVASNQCAALVSLARGAELSKPYPGLAAGSGQAHDDWSVAARESGDPEWFEWKTMEERKRTLYAVFVLSSMLVMAYNRAPSLTNSEIRLDLPCDEELWMAENGTAWRSLGGSAAAQSKCIPFARALTHLLTAAQRERQAAEQFNSMGGDSWQQADQNSVLNPSSFGCLVLIDALHNYIWETRQRHLGKQWTTQDVEAMHAHIEPALRAWSAAWSSNPLHVIERPNPFGAGPLPADSIPLLDLAYVRLFVDFGRSKEAYWHREYDAMAQELAKGPETGYTADTNNQDVVASPVGQGSNSRSNSHDNLAHANDTEVVPSSHTPAKASRRERHLRKAAFYAADHLMNADRLGIAFADNTSRDLPMQSVLCACDCAQVLSEWVTTLQERIGRYVGVIGRDEINLREVPAILMLDEEDLKLLERIEELLAGVEQQAEDQHATEEAKSGGYASRVLVLTSQTMAKAALWPVTTLMAQSLEIQARHVKSRVLGSL